LKELSVVMTVYNEQETILDILRLFYEVLEPSGLDYEIIVLNNGSTDLTWRLLEWCRDKLPLKIITNAKPKSYLEALKQVILESDRKWVFFTDADLQYDPREILNFYRGNRYDIVNGVKVRRKDPPLRLIQTYMFHFFTGLVFGKWFKDPNTGFRLISRRVVQNVVPKLKYLKCSPGTEMLYRAHKKGYKILEIGVSHRYRRSGRSKISDISNLKKVLSSQLHGLYHLWKELVWD